MKSEQHTSLSLEPVALVLVPIFLRFAPVARLSIPFVGVGLGIGLHPVPVRQIERGRRRFRSAPESFRFFFSALGAAGVRVGGKTEQFRDQ